MSPIGTIGGDAGRRTSCSNYPELSDTFKRRKKQTVKRNQEKTVSRGAGRVKPRTATEARQKQDTVTTYQETQGGETIRRRIRKVYAVTVKKSEKRKKGVRKYSGENAGIVRQLPLTHGAGQESKYGGKEISKGG